jgi:hypothetical protein
VREGSEEELELIEAGYEGGGAISAASPAGQV